MDTPLKLWVMIGPDRIFSAEGREEVVLREYHAFCRPEATDAGAPAIEPPDVPSVPVKPAASLGSSTKTRASVPTMRGTDLSGIGLLADSGAERAVARLAEQLARRGMAEETAAQRIIKEMSKRDAGRDGLANERILKMLSEAAGVEPPAAAAWLAAAENSTPSSLASVIGQSLRLQDAIERAAQSAAPSTPAPISGAVMTSVFETDAHGFVRLRRQGPTPTASLLLALYGFRALRGQTAVTGGALQAMLAASEVPVSRLDREIEAVPDMVTAEGERRGRRYGLTEAGRDYVEQMLRGWEAEMPPK